MDGFQFVRGKRWLNNIFLLTSDLIGFGMAIGLVAVSRHLIFHVEYQFVFDIQGIRTLVYLLLFSLIMLTARGLYPGWMRSPVIELKQIVEAVTLAYVLTAVIIFIQGAGIDFSRSVFILSWFFSIFLIPVGRFLVRKYTSRSKWWGEPVLVIGTKARIRQVESQLEGCPRFGLRPVIGLAVDDISPKKGEPMPVLTWSQERQDEIQRTGIRTCVLANPSNDLRRDHPRVYRQIELSFAKLVFIINDDIANFMMSQPLDIAGVPAILSEQSLFEPTNLLLKRLIDILLVAVLFIPFLILGGILALWIVIDSPGPVFYTQQRVGRNRAVFQVYKFRTMVQNSDEVLAKMLKDPAVRLEWEHYHKIAVDNRITRVGKWLRRLSLDELPQLINIFRGEMSLVGPRPYLVEELAKMGDAAETILHVQPGITGWWQVMGRNNLSHQERIRLELYYVSNWSWWLDLFIIIKTFWVMFFLRDGR